MKYDLSRSITIDADIDKVFEHIKDFKKWSEWSPWTSTEPDHKQSITGKAGEIGHKMEWNGKIIGSGEQTVEAVNGHQIDYDLQFLTPWKSSAKTHFKVEKTGNKSKVTWSMESSMPFFLFWMIGTMKSWIEMDYDRGLGMLKEICEKGKIKAKTTSEGVVNFGGFSYVGIKNTAPMEEMPKEMGTDFEKIHKMLHANGKTAKHWISIYTKIHMKSKTFTWIAACSDEELEGVVLGPEFIRGTIDKQKMLKIHHAGSYRFLGNAWGMGMMMTHTKKMKQNGKPFEYYLNNPLETAEDDLKTDIYFPIKSS